MATEEHNETQNAENKILRQKLQSKSEALVTFGNFIFVNCYNDEIFYRLHNITRSIVWLVFFKLNEMFHSVNSLAVTGNQWLILLNDI